jgi:WG containing repeat
MTQRIVFTFTLGMLMGLWQLTAQNIGANWVVPAVLDSDKFDLSPKEYNQRFVVQKDGKSGLYDKSGKQLLPFDYDRITLYSCGWISTAAKGKLQLLNDQFQDISLPYHKVEPINNGTAIVYKDSLYGLLNMQGEELVPLKYKRCKRQSSSLEFVDADGSSFLFQTPPNHVADNVKQVNMQAMRSPLSGYLALKKGNMIIGLLNAAGDTIIPPIYEILKSFHPDKGYITATFDKKTWGVIDIQHRTIYPFTAERMGIWTKSGLLPVRIDQKWGVIRIPEDEIVVPFGNYELIETYDPANDWFLVTQNKKVGLIDVAGNIILPCQYEYISEVGHVTNILSANRKYGFWNRKSGYLHPPEFSQVRNAGDTLVIVTRDSLSAVINSVNGQVIIPEQPYEIEFINPYFDSHRKVLKKYQETAGGHVHGYYSRSGALIFPHDSVNLLLLNGGPDFLMVPLVEDSRKDCEWRTADGKVLKRFSLYGKFLLQEGFYTSYVMYGNGIQKAQRIVHRDAQGNERPYDSLHDLQENLHRIKLDQFWGFVDRTGQVVVPPVLEVAELSKDGYIKVKYQGKWGVLQNPKFDYFKQ